MRKQALLYLLLMILCFSLIGCGAKNSSDDEGRSSTSGFWNILPEDSDEDEEYEHRDEDEDEEYENRDEDERIEDADVDAENTEGYEYSVNDDGTCTITSGHEFSMNGDISIPSKIDGYEVTCIGESAFSDCTSLTSVIIPESVIEIGNRAFFNCNNVESISIPESVTSIGNYAFANCNCLTDITITDNVTAFGTGVFCGCNSLTSVHIPASVTTLGMDSFGDCSSLTSIEIPNGVTYIGEYAFDECDALTEVVIPDSVTYIGEEAFSYCDSLTSITLPNSALEIDDYAFSVCPSLESVTIPEGVISIGEQAFFDCSSLTTIIIPDSVTYIGNRAFYAYESSASFVVNPGSYAETWANELGYEIVSTDSVPTQSTTGCDLQSFSYVPSDEFGEAIYAPIPFTITYNNDVLYASNYMGNDPCVYYWENRDIYSPQAFMFVREGNWQDYYYSTNPSELTVYGGIHDIREVYEVEPLTINGYEGYFWTTHLTMAEGGDWNNDIYTYVIQLDENRFFYLESSRMDLEGRGTFEEFLSELIYEITLP